MSHEDVTQHICQIMLGQHNKPEYLSDCVSRHLRMSPDMSDFALSKSTSWVEFIGSTIEYQQEHETIARSEGESNGQEVGSGELASEFMQRKGCLCASRHARQTNYEVHDC